MEWCQVGLFVALTVGCKGSFQGTNMVIGERLGLVQKKKQSFVSFLMASQEQVSLVSPLSLTAHLRDSSQEWLDDL